MDLRALVTGILVCFAPFAAKPRAETASNGGASFHVPPDVSACSVVIQVENHARVPADMLDAAEREAAAIYAIAGVRTAWAHGSEPDGSNRPMDRVTVLLLDRGMTDKKVKTDGVPNGVIGRAARATGRAEIFYFRLAQMALARGGMVSDLLGKALAHEIGHLLLPTDGHSRRGIMRARLEISPTRVPRFTDGEARAMCEALVRPVGHRLSASNFNR